MDEQNWDDMILGLRKGDAKACHEFWHQYGERLQLIAQQQLSKRLQRRVGSDDIVQSACRTFFRRMGQGQFDLPDADALWRLMCAITLSKARRAARDHMRKKRVVSNEQYLDEEIESGIPSMEVAANDASPVDAVIFGEQLGSLLDSLSPQECQVLDLKLQNHTEEEIAAKAGCSERTVRRVYGEISKRWSGFFDETEK